MSSGNFKQDVYGQLARVPESSRPFEIDGAVH